MIRCVCDHGVFIWTLPTETCYISLETDDLLSLSKTRTPSLHLKQELEKLFDLTVCECSILKFLNLRVVLSPSSDFIYLNNKLINNIISNQVTK